jgi:cytochrome c-type biogenesis protein CcmH
VGDQDPVLLTDFAEALALENGGQWQGRPNELLKTALNLDATAQKTLWFSGVSAIQRADYPSALNYWQQLLTQISPAETEKIQLLQRQIANLQTFIQSETTTFPAPTSPVVNLTVQVSLASDFQNLVKPTDNVFIYARAPNGSAMPLVIVKKTVADLPLTVTLNQETVVIPNVNLTDFKEVTLVARVAKSGQVTPQPGDLQGLLTPISIHESNPIILVINEMIP